MQLPNRYDQMVTLCADNSGKTVRVEVVMIAWFCFDHAWADSANRILAGLIENPSPQKLEKEIES